MTPLISICHASARPHAWRAAHDEWRRKCVNPYGVEYVLAVHGSETYEEYLDAPSANPSERFGAFALRLNPFRSCSVDGWNVAAAEAHGKLLIGIADDFFPPDRWDELLLGALPSVDGEYVLGAHMGREDGLLTHYFVTRKRYARYGYLLNPAYEALYCDNEFTAVARLDGVLIQTGLRFEHRHPHHGFGQWDAVYEKENRSDARDGMTYLARQASGFPR